MHTQQLSPHQVEPSHAIERSEERAIESEIAVRLLEQLGATSRDRLTGYIERIYQITKPDNNPDVLMLISELQQLAGPKRTHQFISKLNAISQLTEREAIWVVLGLITGDLTQLTVSYEETGKIRSLDKQAVQQQLERVIIGLKLVYPDMADAIIQLRHITANVKQDNFNQ